MNGLMTAKFRISVALVGLGTLAGCPKPPCNCDSDIDCLSADVEFGEVECDLDTLCEGGKGEGRCVEVFTDDDTTTSTTPTTTP